MAIIKINTLIQAPIQKCFDLSRSIDLHMQSMEHTNERAVGGVTAGLIELNETVMWKAKHFGVTQSMTIKITAMHAPYYFVDEQVTGPFKKLKHRHSFVQKGNYTLMSDEFEFASPYGWIGKIVDTLFLKSYMKQLLIQRNQVIRTAAEA